MYYIKPRKKLKIIIYVLLATVFALPLLGSLKAQDEVRGYVLNKVEVKNVGKELTGKELQIFKEETRKKIDQLQGQMSKIASRKESSAVKKIYKNQTLKLFLNNGKRVTIEVSSITTNRIRDYEIPVYLNRLANLAQYHEVIMKRADACILSDYYEAGLDANGNQIYKATATIYQEFIGKDENGKIIYYDKTTKTFEITLMLVPTVLDESGYRWAALLGDIKVAGTHP